MIYEDPRIYSCIAVDILRSFFLLFNANSRTHLWAEKGSGKTNQCNLFRALMFHPIASPDFSSASIYRTIEATGGTIICDDFDDLQEEEKQRLNRHIKVNYKPFKAVRSDGGGKFRPQGYDAYSHLVFNNIYGVDDEITKDRVNTFKLLRHKDAPDIEVDYKDKQFSPLRDDLYICLLQYWEQVQESFNKLKIPDLRARNLENWKPQLAIAKLIDQVVLMIFFLMQKRTLSRINSMILMMIGSFRCMISLSVNLSKVTMIRMKRIFHQTRSQTRLLINYISSYLQKTERKRSFN